jgi:toxin-antitoxin system PIN domain toxin
MAGFACVSSPGPTSARVFARPLTIAAAWKQMTEWLDHPRVWIPEPTEEHASILQDLLLDANVTGNLIADAHLAALAIEHGLTVCSADSDFARFAGISWINPMTDDSVAATRGSGSDPRRRQPPT